APSRAEKPTNDSAKLGLAPEHAPREKGSLALGKTSDKLTTPDVTSITTIEWSPQDVWRLVREGGARVVGAAGPDQPLGEITETDQLHLRPIAFDLSLYSNQVRVLDSSFLVGDAASRAPYRSVWIFLGVDLDRRLTAAVRGEIARRHVAPE